MNSEKDQAMLHGHPKLFGFLFGSVKWKFQHTNDTCHTYKSTKECLRKKIYNVLP